MHRWVLLLLLFFCCCGNNNRSAQQWMIPNGKVKVLSTIAMIDDLVKEIGGDFVDSETLIKGELDPHSYQLVKGDDEKLAFADVIFFNGLGLEHSPSLHHYLQQNKKVVALGNEILKENREWILYHDHQVDPHIWMDVSLWAKTVPYIVKTLSARDPIHTEEYQLRGEALIETMQKTHREMHSQLQAIPVSKRYLVTTHDAFSYFTRAYLAEENEVKENEMAWRQRCAAPEGLAPESQISSADIQKIISHLKTYDIHTIFPESNVNRDSIRKVVQAGREQGLTIEIADVDLYGDAMGKPGSDSDTYLKMLRHNANAIASKLSGI